MRLRYGKQLQLLGKCGQLIFCKFIIAPYSVCSDVISQDLSNENNANNKQLRSEDNGEVMNTFTTCVCSKL